MIVQINCRLIWIIPSQYAYWVSVCELSRRVKLYLIMLQGLWTRVHHKLWIIEVVSWQILTSSEMASFSPSRILKYLQAFLILLSIPFLFLVYIILNVLKRIAPKLLFNIASEKLPKFNQWKFSKEISSVEDLDFLFSYDIFEVSLGQ